MSAARAFLVLGSLLMFVGVGAGAFGSHALRRRVAPERLAAFETGVRYQLLHALGLFAPVVVGSVRPDGDSSQVLVLVDDVGVGVIWAGWLFVAGVALFSGSLYALALTGERRWGAVTPFGGACFLAGWLLLAWAAFGRAL